MLNDEMVGWIDVGFHEVIMLFDTEIAFSQ